MEDKSLTESLANEIYSRRIAELKKNYRVSQGKNKRKNKSSTAHAKRPKNDFLKKNKVVKGKDGILHVKGDKSFTKSNFNNESVLDVKMFEETAQNQANINSTTIQKEDSKNFTLVLGYDTDQVEWKGDERYSVSPFGGTNYGKEKTEKIGGLVISYNDSNEGYHINKNAPKSDKLIRQAIASWAMNNGLSVQVESVGEEEE